MHNFASYGDIPAAVERRGLDPQDVAPPYPVGQPSASPANDYPSFDSVGHSTHNRKASSRSTR